MPKGWEEEVREILERAGDLEKRSRAGQGPRRQPPQPAPNLFSAIGEAVGRRFASPRDMLVTGVSLVVAALLLTVVPGGRYVFPYVAALGALILVGAYVRTLMAGRHASPESRTWRGRVIERPNRWGPLGRFFGRRDGRR